MSYIYISIVGQQIFSVINPFSILRKELPKQGLRLEKVILLATKKTENNANKISNLLKSVYVENVNISLINVSSLSVKDDHGPPAQEVFSQYLDQRFIFNLAGGLKFQVALCATIAFGKKASGLFIYPDRKSYYITQIVDGAFKTYLELDSDDAKPDLLRIEDILDSHEIEYSHHPKAENHTDKVLEILSTSSDFNERGIAVPDNHLRNIKIGKVRYDYIWNDFNKLVFITALCPGDKVQNNKILEFARDIGSSASSKDIIPNLYHRRFIVLTNQEYQHERIEKNYKIEDVIAVEHILKADTGMFSDLLALSSEVPWGQIKKMFTSTSLIPIRSTERNNEPQSIESLELESGETHNLLVMVLGMDILPTMIAAFSCNDADELILLYTPDSDKIAELKKAIKKNFKYFKGRFKRLSFYPISFFGEDILDLPVKPHQKIKAVLTSGTKSQGYFVTLMASQKQGEMYSIVTHAGHMEGLEVAEGSPERYPLSGPDPAHILKMQGYVFTHDQGIGEDGESLLRDQGLFEALLSFIREIVNQKDYSVKKFFYQNTDKSFKKRVGKYVYSQDRSLTTLKLPSGSVHKWDLNGGDWFERLTGYALIKCGADQVRVRVRIKWSKETENKIKSGAQKNKKWEPGKSIFMEDIDVVARFGGNYYVISCKAAPKAPKTSGANVKSLSQIADEARAFALRFGRYCIPMVCFLKNGDDPDQPEECNDVMILGYNTLIDSEKLKLALATAAAKKRTENKRSTQNTG